MLVPGALPDDGLLDVFVASPHGIRHWVKLVLRLITRRPKKDDQVDQAQARTVRVTLRAEENYQLGR